MRRGGAMRYRAWPALIGIVVTLLASGACAPAAPGSSGAGTSASSVSRGPKMLTLAVQREGKGFAKFTGAAAGGGNPGAGNNQISKIGHSYLALDDGTGTFIPQLAYELPSIEKGTWRVNPDGTMDTTWKLRPNVKWHDGHPFTSADLMFTYQLNKDPDLVPPTSATSRMESVTAPDDLTFLVHWSAPYLIAERDTLTEIAPRHLLADAYAADKTRFIGLPYLTSEFVGLGPYRMVKWEPGPQ